MQKKLNLLNMTRQKLHHFFLSIGEKSFRADQVMKWIYHHYCDDFDQMTDINNNLRVKLKTLTEIRAPEVEKEQYSSDGTIKWTLKIDQQAVETVYIPEGNRITLCISSQIGCALQCTFCSTAKAGFSRNLQTSEIIGQLWRVAKITKPYSITNIVMMGMGEPLLNLKNVVNAIKIMMDRFGFGLSKRRITLSTAGVVPALEKLGDMIDVGLAISLHAPNDAMRNQIMPINRKYDIKSFLSAVNCYLKKSKANQGRVTVEYIMLDHINDELEHAYQLAMCLKNTPCKINLIPWNYFSGVPYSRSSTSRINRFAKAMIDHGFITTIRKTRGEDISAACGQLVGKINNHDR